MTIYCSFRSKKGKELYNFVKRRLACRPESMSGEIWRYE